MRQGPECSICAYGKIHACWPPEILAKRQTHCKDCHETWGGHARAHCTLCHATFASYGVSDHHWTKLGHLHPREIRGFWADEEGFWHFGTRQDAAALSRTLKAPIREPETAT